MEIVQMKTPEVVPRDGFDRPMVVPEGGGKPVPYARTTTYIDCIEDKSSLSTWGKRSVLVGAARRQDIIETVRELVGTGNINSIEAETKRELDGLAEKCLASAGANDKREQGTHLHELSELVDQHIPLPADLPEADLMDMAAYALATYGLSFKHIEEFVVCDELKVGGTPDRVCNVDASAWEDVYVPPGVDLTDDFIFDLKTGTMEYGGLKMAAQLAIYSRAKFYRFRAYLAPARRREDHKDGEANTPEWDKWVKTEHEPADARTPLPRVNQEWGIILSLPSGTATAELYWVDLKVGWRAAELATSIREMRSLSGRATVSFAKAQAQVDKLAAREAKALAAAEAKAAKAAERIALREAKAAEREAIKVAKAAERLAAKEAKAAAKTTPSVAVVCNADTTNNEGITAE